MSIRAMTWAFDAVVGEPKAKIVLIALADSADDETGRCWPSLGNIGRRCELSESSVKRAIRYLVASNFLKREDRYRDNGSQASSMFTVLVGGGVSSNGHPGGGLIDPRVTTDPPGGSLLTPLEPSIEPSVSNSRRGAAPKTVLPSGWSVSPELMSYGKSRGLTEQQVLDAAETLKSWADENSDRPIGRKRNWSRAFEGWLRREAERARSNGANYGQGRPRAFQDDSRSVSRAAARLAEAASRGEFSFGPVPTGRPSESETDFLLLPKR